MKPLCYLPDVLLAIVTIGGVYHGSNSLGVAAVVCCCCLIGARIFADFKQREMEVSNKTSTEELRNKINALMIRAGMKQ